MGAHYTSGFATQTVALWVKQADTGGAQILYEEGAGSHGMALVIDNGVLKGGVAASGHERMLTDSTAADLADGDWHHLALTYGDTAKWIRLYVDGAEVDAMDTTFASIPAHGDPEGVGYLNSGFSLDGSVGATTTFSGWADDLYVYEDALDATALGKMTATRALVALGDLNLVGASHLVLTAGVPTSFTSITAGHESTVTGDVVVLGDLNIVASPGTLGVTGNFEVEGTYIWDTDVVNVSGR